jgi:peptidyl-prolyl cis-trans isomerase SurA
LDKLQAGEISPVLESGNGFHLLALTEVETSSGVPKEYKTRHILKALAPNANADNTLKEIQNLKSQILAGIDFAKIAQTESQDPGTAPDGGSLGWIKAEQIDPLFAQAMIGLEIGEISDPVRTKFGLHIIEVLEIRNLVGAPTLESRVRQRIFAEKVDEKMQDLLNDIKQIALIEVVSQ